MSVRMSPPLASVRAVSVVAKSVSLTPKPGPGQSPDTRLNMCTNGSWPTVQGSGEPGDAAPTPRRTAHSEATDQNTNGISILVARRYRG
jgi:hypothetical protein